MMYSLPLVLISFISLVNGAAINSWPKLLNAPQTIFPENVGSVQFSGSASSQDLLANFQELLEDSNILTNSYANYRSHYDTEYGTLKMGVGSIESFKENLVKILTHNLKAANGESSYEQGVNQFTDMSSEEIQGTYRGCLKQFSENGLAGNSSSHSTTIEKPNLAKLSGLSAKSDIDWRNYGVVTSVKNQQGCGSCVFFAAIGTLESSHALWHNKEIKDLSEQELVDCAKGNGNNGCSGGTFVPTFNYLKDKGVADEKQYPYEAKDGQCRSGGRSRAAKITRWNKGNKEGDENRLKESVASYGPVAVAIHVSDELARYSKGIFEGPCEGGRNHAVVVVGYNGENGKDYWSIKNQWGEGWGEKGYIRIQRNAGNKCDVAGDTVIMTA